MDGNKSSKEGKVTVLNITYNLNKELQAFYETYATVSKYIDIVIFPTVAMMGFLGNAISCVIIVKSGLNKPSNIFLLGLAVADFFLMFKYVNIPMLLKYSNPTTQWTNTVESIVINYSVTMTINCVTTNALGMSTALTVFITIERIVAVFFPLRFSRIVTPKIAKIGVLISFLVSVPSVVILPFKYRLVILYMGRYGGWIGYMLIHSNWEGSILALYDETMTSYILPIIPTVIVTIGCVLIGAKVGVALRRQKRMTLKTGNKRASTRTRTLFMVSFSFSVTRISYFFLYLPQIDPNNIPQAWLYIAIYYAIFSNFLTLCNSACNFFIYVIFNPKFRQLIIQSFCYLQRKK